MSQTIRRRSFFRHALAAAITSGLSVQTTVKANEPEGECTLTVSLADSLITFMGLLARIESLAVNELQDVYNKKYQAFSSAYLHLYGIAQELRKKICPSPLDGQIQQICSLAATGVRSAQAAEQSSLQIGGALNEQIGKVAECLPQADKMDAVAMDLLQKLLRKVEEVRKLQCESDIANDKVRQKRAEFESDTSEIRNLLRSSVSALLRFERASSAKQKSLTSQDVVDTLNNCITKLGQLRPKLNGPQQTGTLNEDTSISNLDLLALLLVGARERVRLQSTSRVDNLQPDRPLRNHVPPVPPRIDVRPFVNPVKAVLANAACRQPSDEDALACIRAIQLVPIVGTLPGFLGFLSRLTDAAIQQGIKAALKYAFKIDQTFKCYSDQGVEVSPDFGAIAQGLLPIRKRIG